MVKKIVLYESSDGKRFNSYTDCERYERECIIEECLKKFNLSKEDFERITNVLGITNNHYFFNKCVDKHSYIDALENIFYKLNEIEMEKSDLYLACKTLCVYIEMYHSVEHD